MNVVDKAILVEALPSEHASRVTDSLVATINQITADDTFKEIYRDNILGYSSVLKRGVFALNKYIEAVRYASYFLLGHTQVEAYQLAFPDRYHRLVHVENANDKRVSSVANIYHKGKLVTEILNQARVPVSLLNADKFQQAVNVQADLMITAKSEMVRMQAANSLMTHLKPPEDAKIELDITHKDSNSAVNHLNGMIQQLAEQQREAIANGTMSPRKVASDPIIVEHVEDGDGNS